MKRLTRSLRGDLPRYPEKVLQFGEGNFLRAFVDWQIDVMNEQTNFNGSVVAVQPRGQGKTEKLNQQDGLFTLFLQGIKEGEAVSEHRVISSISRGMDLFNHYEEYLQLARSKDLRFIISNTTEAGITFDATDTLADRPQKSFPAKLTAFLYERFLVFDGDAQKGVIVLPCELIEKNGELLQTFVLQYAELWQLGEPFTAWLTQANTFCNSMVDRIVPGYPVDTAQELTQQLGYLDEYLVVAEQYHLWVIEGPPSLKEEFPAQKAGLNTIIVDDLTAYRTRKVRILNGAHTAMTPVSYLYGVDTVAETVTHEKLGAYIHALIYEEIIPSLDLPVEELEGYAADVLDRFRNPFIQHYLLSISLNSIAKFKARNVPTLLAYYERKHTLPKRLVFAFAALFAFYRGQRGEEVIPLADDAQIIALFNAQWATYDGTFTAVQQVVETILQHEVWGVNLHEIPHLTTAVSKALFEIETMGMKAALESLVDSCHQAQEEVQDGCHSTKSAR